MSKEKTVWISLHSDARLEDIYRSVRELLEELEGYMCTELTGKAREEFLIKEVWLTPEEIKHWPFRYVLCTKPGKRVVIVTGGL
jgi:heme-degrading monooxygenase HmoA